MAHPITLRPLTPDDGPAFAQLLLAAPDTGRIHLTLHYVVDPYEAIRASQSDDFLGVAAETPGFDGLVSAGLEAEDSNRAGTFVFDLVPGGP